mgnify:CR=1 FL=1
MEMHFQRKTCEQEPRNFGMNVWNEAKIKII